MNKIQFTKEQHIAFQHLRLVYDHTNHILIKKGYGAYIPLGLAVVQISTIEDAFKHNVDEYNERYHQRILQLIDILKPSFYSEKVRLFNFEMIPYSDGYTKELIDQIENKLSDNYFGIFASLVSYEGLIQALINAGLPKGDKRVNAVKQMHDVSINPDSHVLPQYHSNEILYHTIKGQKPIVEVDKKLPKDEQRTNELLMLLIDEFQFKLDQPPIDLRASKYPKRENLWDALVNKNHELFDDLSQHSINRFFRIQSYCVYSDAKTT